MHENVTHNRDDKTFAEFRREILKFLRHTVPRGRKHFCDRITNNFRVIHSADFRLLAYRGLGRRRAERTIACISRLRINKNVPLLALDLLACVAVF
jgi:hypothetical protein